MYIPVENELELRLGFPCVNVGFFPTPRGIYFYFFLIRFLFNYLFDSSLGSIDFVGQRHFWIEVWTQLGTEKGVHITDMDPAHLSHFTQGQHQRAQAQAEESI